MTQSKKPEMSKNVLNSTLFRSSS